MFTCYGSQKSRLYVFILIHVEGNKLLVFVEPKGIFKNILSKIILWDPEIINEFHSNNGFFWGWREGF